MSIVNLEPFKDHSTFVSTGCDLEMLPDRMSSSHQVNVILPMEGEDVAGQVLSRYNDSEAWGIGKWSEQGDMFGVLPDSPLLNLTTNNLDIQIIITRI